MNKIVTRAGCRVEGRGGVGMRGGERANADGRFQMADRRRDERPGGGADCGAGNGGVIR
jgi:hypothetical protein